MDLEAKVQDVQKRLENTRLDGWLLYDFRRQNNLACQFLEIADDEMLTRRFFYWIPREGAPIKITHMIELHPYDHLPGKRKAYQSWEDLEKILRILFQGKKKIAMEYSPKNQNPYVSKVDGGTVDLIRSYGIEVESSAELMQKYTSTLSDFQWESHLYAMGVVEKAIKKSWGLIAEALENGNTITEYDVSQFILGVFENHACKTEGNPICAVNENSANPHYFPRKESAKEIRKGDFILIDLWCKQKVANSIYADVSNVAVVADKPTVKQQEVFGIIKEAQKVAIQLIVDRFRKGKEVMGWEVDQEARSLISSYGYGQFFTHRTGHNIGVNDHGDGAHLDNWETKDRRPLIPRTLFSVEPGIYLPGEFGVRLEYNVFIDGDGKVGITGGEQKELVCLGGVLNNKI